ncbi:MAG: hypothetical protein V7696_14275 [Halioglobus sp.]
MTKQLLPLATIICAALLGSCAVQTPSLERLYKTSNSLVGHPPVILIHGAFGARLCNSDEKELWPGSLRDVIFSDYRDLALATNLDPANEHARLHTCGLTDTVAGQDFYGAIEATLTGAGGYTFSQPGQPVQSNQRNYYRFTYDWRQDNATSAAALDRYVEQIRLDHGNPDLKVDIVAHSMGGLVTRYWLRYGTRDVLSGNDFPINNDGAKKTRKIILLGTPNLGSTAALQQLLEGADFGVNKIGSDVLLSFPSAYQLLPHPIADSIISDSGNTLSRDLFDSEIWRSLEWGPFDEQVRRSLQDRAWTTEDISLLESYTHKHLERARRFVWALTVENTARPYELIVFGGDCVPTPARVLIENVGDDSHVRLWPSEMQNAATGIDYEQLMLEPGDGAVTKASLLARTALDPSVPRHRFSDFPLDYAVMFCEDHSKLPGNITFQDNLLHILLSQ